MVAQSNRRRHGICSFIIINSVVTTYYQIAYLNDAISTTNETIKYYTDIGNIMQTRLAQGVADAVSVDQAQQAVLNGA